MITPKLPIDHAEARYEALAAFGGGSMLAALILPAFSIGLAIARSCFRLP
jgi:hypothetical protein